MTDPTEPKREHPSTYFVQDRSNLDELTRIRVQDQMLTTMMGGVLPEQTNPTAFQTVLDVGCGTGNWLIDFAKTYPNTKRLVGVDISAKFLEYARAQAEAEQLSDRIEFHTMDALRLLEFPADTFDLVNHRLAMGWARKWDWPNLLRQYQRVCKPEGTIRVTEGELLRGTPALNRLSDLTLEAFYQAGNYFTLTDDGITGQLAGLFTKYGIQNVQTLFHTPTYRYGTTEWHHFFDDTRLAYRNLVPFLRKWTRVPDDYDDIYQQMLVEFERPDFVATWNMRTAWGTRTSN